MGFNGAKNVISAQNSEVIMTSTLLFFQTEGTWGSSLRRNWNRFSKMSSENLLLHLCTGHWSWKGFKNKKYQSWWLFFFFLMMYTFVFVRPNYFNTSNDRWWSLFLCLVPICRKKPSLFSSVLPSEGRSQGRCSRQCKGWNSHAACAEVLMFTCSPHTEQPMGGCELFLRQVVCVS